MPIKAKYAHTNLIANDLERIVAFYVNVFGFSAVEAPRTQSSEAFGRITRLPGAAIRVQHLRFPQSRVDGPTLEVISYNKQLPLDPPMPNRPGFRHICLDVEDVDAALAEVVANGGGSVGEAVRSENPRSINHVVYATDPEGNIVELLKRMPK